MSKLVMQETYDRETRKLTMLTMQASWKRNSEVLSVTSVSSAVRKFTGHTSR